MRKDNEKDKNYIASLNEEIYFINKILEKHAKKIIGKMNSQQKLIEDEDGLIPGKDITEFMHKIIEQPINGENKEGRIIPFKFSESGKETEDNEKVKKFFEWLREKMIDILTRGIVIESDKKTHYDDREH